jgi:NADPH-dependent curcumin reductase CurA
MIVVNHQFRLAARPVGRPKRTDWTYTEEPVPEPGGGEFLVKILYLSLDPAMRGWMNEGRSYIRPVDIGDVMRALRCRPGHCVESSRLHRGRPRGGDIRGTGIRALGW